MFRLYCTRKLLLIHNEGNWPNDAYSSFQCWFPREFSGSTHSSSLIGASLDLQSLSTRKLTPNNVKSRENALEGMSSPLGTNSFNVHHSLPLRKLHVRTMLPGLEPKPPPPSLLTSLTLASSPFPQVFQRWGCVSTCHWDFIWGQGHSSEIPQLELIVLI